MSIEHFHIQNYAYCKSRHSELINETKTARQVRLIMESQRTHGRAFTRALRWLGRCLITWGEMLEERTGSRDEIPVPSASFT